MTTLSVSLIFQRQPHIFGNRAMESPIPGRPYLQYDRQNDTHVFELFAKKTKQTNKVKIDHVGV